MDRHEDSQSSNLQVSLYFLSQFPLLLANFSQRTFQIVKSCRFAYIVYRTFTNGSAIEVNMRLERDSPIALLKACKNEAELAAMRDCHLRDGSAVVEFLHWLETTLRDDNTLKISEVDLVDKLKTFRAKCNKFLYPSFDTIAGVNENGAIIHYRYETLKLNFNIVNLTEGTCLDQKKASASI